MGLWMTLTRHDAARVGALLRHPEGAEAGRARLRAAWEEGLTEPALRDGAPLLECVEENDDIRRNWDGLHVLLTGCTRHDGGECGDEDGGRPVPCGPAPARDAVMGGLPLSPGGGGWRNTPLLLMPDEVRAVHGFLRGIDVPALVRERAGLVERAGVYSFRMTVARADGSSRVMSMIEDGSLAAALEGVRGFYARAADDGNAVIKDIA